MQRTRTNTSEKPANNPVEKRSRTHPYLRGVGPSEDSGEKERVLGVVKKKMQTTRWPQKKERSTTKTKSKEKRSKLILSF